MESGRPVQRLYGTSEKPRCVVVHVPRCVLALRIPPEGRHEGRRAREGVLPGRGKRVGERQRCLRKAQEEEETSRRRKRGGEGAIVVCNLHVACTLTIRGGREEGELMLLAITLGQGGSGS